MANSLSLNAILLLLATSSILMVMVASDRCKELIGECSNDCNNKCSSAHNGGSGLCEPSGNNQQGCWCYYDCPPLQKCGENFKLEGECTDQKCDIACAAKYPGHGAEGHCTYDDDHYYVCDCNYFCNPPATTSN